MQLPLPRLPTEFVDLDPADELGLPEDDGPEEQGAADPPVRVPGSFSFRAGPGEILSLTAVNPVAARLILDLVSGAQRPLAGRIERRGSVCALHRMKTFVAAGDGRLSVGDRLEMLFALSGWSRAAIRAATDRAIAVIGLPASARTLTLAKLGSPNFRRLAFETAIELAPDVMLADASLLKEIPIERRRKLWERTMDGRYVVLIAGDGKHAGDGPLEIHSVLDAKAIGHRPTQAESKSPKLSLVEGWTIEARIEPDSGTVRLAVVVTGMAGLEIDAIRAAYFVHDRKITDVGGRNRSDSSLPSPTILLDHVAGATEVTVNVFGWCDGLPALLSRTFAVANDGGQEGLTATSQTFRVETCLPARLLKRSVMP